MRHFSRIVCHKSEIFRQFFGFRLNLWHTHKIRKISNTWPEPKELRIPVSYGHIAAKVWGKETDRPVLAMHGWLDNAGTFDRLIPLLSPKLYIVAIDAPGHGLSSHKPIGCFYDFLEMLFTVQRVVDYFNWNTFSILGHSMGGRVGLMYASVFPEAVSNIALLDIIKPVSCDSTLLPSFMQKNVINFLKMEKKMANFAPVYSIEEARERLIAGYYNEINRDSIDFLLRRGTRPSDCGKGVVFCRDVRVNLIEYIHLLSHNDAKVFMSKIKSNLMIISGKSSSNIFTTRTPEVLDDFLNIYKDNCLSFHKVEVEGNHFVHLNNPEIVAPHVNAFFEQHCT